MRNNNFFLGIGAQKAGTSWLANYLVAHPQVCMSPIKELHFFDEKLLPAEIKEGFDFVRMYKETVNKYNSLIKELEQGAQHSNRSQKLFINDPEKASILKRLMVMENHLLLRVKIGLDEKKYLNFFDKISSNEKICGEITPSYSMLDAEAFAFIKKLIPACRIIFIMRNPVERYWSGLKQKSKEIKRWHNISFEPTQQFINCIKMPIFYLKTDYERIIKNLYQVFDQENILILFYEKMFFSDKKYAYLKKITDFLGIDYIKPDLDKISNQSAKMPLEPQLRRKGIKNFYNVYKFIIENFEDTPQEWLDDLNLIEE